MSNRERTHVARLIVAGGKLAIERVHMSAPKKEIAMKNPLSDYGKSLGEADREIKKAFRRELADHYANVYPRATITPMNFVIEKARGDGRLIYNAFFIEKPSEGGLDLEAGGGEFRDTDLSRLMDSARGYGVKVAKSDRESELQGDLYFCNLIGDRENATSIESQLRSLGH